MTDRLANIVTGLQRLAEGARTKGDDIRSSQKWEDEEHAREITQLLNMVEKVRRVLLEERARFMPVAEGELNQPQAASVDDMRTVEKRAKQILNQVHS